MLEKLTFIPPAEVGVTRESNVPFPVNLLLPRTGPSGFRGIDWALGQQEELVRGNKELDSVVQYAQAHDTQVIAVSPHPDDIPLSIGGLLPHFDPENLWSLSLFTQADPSPYANTPNRSRYLLADNPSVEALNETRTVEDIESNTMLGVPREHQRQLGFIDGPWRTLSYNHTRQVYPSVSISLGRISLDEELVLMPKIIKRIQDEVHSIVGDSRNFLLFAPAALGVTSMNLRHVDHRITRDATVEAFPQTFGQDNIVFYGEYPYLNEATPDRKFRKGPHLPALVGVADQQRKRDAILAHKSQVGRMFDLNKPSHGTFPETLPPELFFLSPHVFPTLRGSMTSYT